MSNEGVLRIIYVRTTFSHESGLLRRGLQVRHHLAQGLLRAQALQWSVARRCTILTCCRYGQYYTTLYTLLFYTHHTIGGDHAAEGAGRGWRHAKPRLARRRAEPDHPHMQAGAGPDCQLVGGGRPAGQRRAHPVLAERRQGPRQRLNERAKLRARNPPSATGGIDNSQRPTCCSVKQGAGRPRGGRCQQQALTAAPGIGRRTSPKAQPNLGQSFQALELRGSTNHP